jgi:hypothetical protein
MIYFVVPRAQEYTIRSYLESWGNDLSGLLHVLHYEDLPGRTSLPAGTYIFSALDQLTAGGTRLVRELRAQLRAAPAVGPVLNDPERALLRFDLLDVLFREGLNRHRAVRANGNLGVLRFPVFLHKELEHTGPLSPLLRTRGDLDRAIGRAVLQGRRLEELLVVEFCDTADPEGLYRKYSAYVVGPAVFSRGMARGHEWMLKADRVEFSEEMLLEERAYALGNPYEGQLRRIFALSGIEFGRIDFAIKDGAVETWEINTNPWIGPLRVNPMPDEFAPLRKPIRDLFKERFHAALEALDTAPSPQPVAVTYSAECRRGASPMVRPPATPGILVRIAGALPRMRPVFNRTARLLSPSVSWVARRFQ